MVNVAIATSVNQQWGTKNKIKHGVLLYGVANSSTPITGREKKLQDVQQRKIIDGIILPVEESYDK